MKANSFFRMVWLALTLAFVSSASGESMAERKRRIMRKYKPRKVAVGESELRAAPFEEGKMVVESREYKKIKVSLERENAPMPPPPVASRAAAAAAARRKASNWLLADEDEEEDAEEDPYATEEDDDPYAEFFGEEKKSDEKTSSFDPYGQANGLSGKPSGPYENASPWDVDASSLLGTASEDAAERYKERGSASEENFGGGSGNNGFSRRGGGASSFGRKTGGGLSWGNEGRASGAGTKRGWSSTPSVPSPSSASSGTFPKSGAFAPRGASVPSVSPHAAYRPVGQQRRPALSTPASRNRASAPNPMGKDAYLNEIMPSSTK